LADPELGDTALPLNLDSVFLGALSPSFLRACVAWRESRRPQVAALARGELDARCAQYASAATRRTRRQHSGMTLPRCLSNYTNLSGLARKIMGNKALFAGLVSDENGQPLDVTIIGGEAQYVLDDNGFRRHIDAEAVDRQVLAQLQAQIEANKDAVEQGIMKMMGSEDIFTKAAIDKSIKDMDQVLKQGIPDDARQMLGMMGFRVVVNYHGEVLRIDQPGVADDSDE